MPADQTPHSQPVLPTQALNSQYTSVSISATFTTTGPAGTPVGWMFREDLFTPVCLVLHASWSIALRWCLHGVGSEKSQQRTALKAAFAWQPVNNTRLTCAQHEVWSAEHDPSCCPPQTLTLSSLMPAGGLNPSGASAGLPSPAFTTANPSILKVRCTAAVTQGPDLTAGDLAPRCSVLSPVWRTSCTARPLS